MTVRLAPVSVRFDVQPLVEGYAVIDVQSGRPLTGSYPRRQDARKVADGFNTARAYGPAALARALQAAASE